MLLSRPHARGLAIALVVTTLATSGCQSLSLPELFASHDARTLASLQPATLTASGTPAKPVSLNEVIEGYEALLPLLDDPKAIASARHRLADLRLQRAEDQLVDQSVNELGVAVESYEQLLAQYPRRAGNDQVYYQLAKAYDLNGDQNAHQNAHLQVLDRLVSEHPDSDFWVEAQFRRGEMLFSKDQYPAAQAAFDAVIQASDQAHGKATFLTNAHYMKGWCQFKQNDYEAALLSYVAVLDILLPANQTVDAVDDQHRTLVEDLFRVMGLSFTYLKGAESLASLFDKVGSKPYEIQVYDRYSKLLLDKEQYSDAIQVYERYIALHPMSPWAPRYHMNIVNTLQKAGFAGAILERKAEFIRTYGITGAYWAQSQSGSASQALDYVKQQLEQLLPELANRHFLKAQQAAASKARHEAAADYQAAAQYYAEFAETFPTHPKTPELLFLLAETRLELQQWAQAIAVFERIAYEVKGHSKAAEAAYASILAYRSYAPTWPPQPAEAYRALLEGQQHSRLRFVAAFPADARAVDVLYLAAQYDYEQKDYPAVVARAQQIIDWQPSPPPKLLVEARLLKAHSLYTLADYPHAEQAYQEARQLLPADDQRNTSVQENQAASVYRQAEARLASGDKLAAVEEFLRVGQAAPNATLRANADYDAATTLIELKQWPRAIEVITAFRQRYPRHEQIQTLPAKMALAYRETEQWALAAGELQTLSAQTTDEAEKRETLLLAAELYDRAQQPEQAILSYRQYATHYPLPLDHYMEAANRLAELYAKAQDTGQRRVWLSKQMEAVDPASQTDDRMRYLAAQAASVLAKEALQVYNGIRLGEPLSETVAKKISALEQAVKAFQKTASYGEASTSTEAGYHIADIYARLGRELMDAERPEGLSELEQSQYDLLLEEQAFPFEEKAIMIHEQNAKRSWNGLYDAWVKRSFDALKPLLPGRYDKPERISEVVDELQ